MKLFLIKFVYVFLAFIMLIYLNSCSLLDLEENKNNIELTQNNKKNNTCPSTKIPSKTASYISSKKYILSIKKIEIACESEIVSNSNFLDIVVQYKAKMELKTNNTVNAKELILPSIYMALVNRENEEILAKMISKIEISSKENNLIVNKKKIRFQYANDSNLFIYFGLQ